MKLFYECPYCGNIVVFENFSGIVPVCCGDEMKELVPGSTDASTEKHIPKCIPEEQKIKVCIGEELHPTTSNHYIDWIAMETNRGYYKRNIPRGRAPKVCFNLGKEESPVAVYSFCNLHGLWVYYFE